MSGNTDRTIKAILTLRDDLPDPTPLKVIGTLLNGAGREIQQSASQCCIFFVLVFFFIIATSIFLTRLFCLSPGVILPIVLRRLLILDFIASFNRVCWLLRFRFCSRALSTLCLPHRGSSGQCLWRQSVHPHRGWN